MGRNLNEEGVAIRKHFHIENNVSKCKLCEERTIIPGTHSGNLAKHLKRHHADTMEDIKRRVKSKLDQQNLTKKKQPVQTNLNYFVTDKKTITLSMTKQDMIDICVELVTLNGLPLRILESNALKKIFDPINAELGLTINRRNIKEYVSVKANEYRRKVTEEVCNKMISIKVDCATRLDRSIMGVNIQFTLDNKIVVRTLAVKEMHEKHSGENLSTEILNICHKFGIRVCQLYSFTSDNAKNMIKTSELIGKAQNSTLDLDSEEEIEEDIRESEIFDEDEVDINMKDKVPILSLVKCMAHTLQLSINDVICKDGICKEILEKVREIVLNLRKPTILTILKDKNLKKPIRSTVTRWSSTYKMVHRLVSLKDFCINMSSAIPKLHLTENEWIQIQDVASVLKFPHDATIRLQEEQLLLSEAYAIIYRCILQLEKHDTSLSKAIYKNLTYRMQESFSKCGPVLAAVYLDPRYQGLLSPNEKQMAKNHLVKLYNHIKNISTCVESDNNNNRAQIDLDSSYETEDEDILTSYLQKKTSITDFNKNNINDASVTLAIDSFDKVSIPPSNENILCYWDKEDKNKMLAKLAKIVLVVPATQVSVERLFSTLKWVLSEKRNQIDENVLEETLFLISAKKYEIY